jgi:hypothetical protein
MIKDVIYKLQKLSDRDKLAWARNSNLRITIYINADEMYMTFDDYPSSTVVKFKNKMVNTQWSVDMLGDMGLNANYS